MCLSKNWDSSRLAICNTCDHTTSYRTYSSLTFFSLQIFISVFMHIGHMYSFLTLLAYKYTAWAGYLGSICFSFLIQVRLVVCRPTLGPQLEHRDFDTVLPSMDSRDRPLAPSLSLCPVPFTTAWCSKRCSEEWLNSLPEPHSRSRPETRSPSDSVVSESLSGANRVSLLGLLL